VLLYGAH